MTHILSTIIYNNGKEVREDILLPPISTKEYEQNYLGKSWILFQSIPQNKINNASNFIKIWRHFYPETESDWKYFGTLKIDL